MNPDAQETLPVAKVAHWQTRRVRARVTRAVIISLSTPQSWRIVRRVRWLDKWVLLVNYMKGVMGFDESLWWCLRGSCALLIGWWVRILRAVWAKTVRLTLSLQVSSR